LYEKYKHALTIALSKVLKILFIFASVYGKSEVFKAKKRSLKKCLERPTAGTFHKCRMDNLALSDYE